MAIRISRRQPGGRRRCDGRRLHPLVLARVLALVTCFLLPMQMRAGAEDAHPHAMLQLILDARDGGLDHHESEPRHAADGHDHEEAGAETGAHEPDVPVAEVSHGVGAGLAILAVVVVLLEGIAAGREAVWPSFARWRGRRPTLEPPPPRWLPICIADHD
jgi:hypothetical protein